MATENLRLFSPVRFRGMEMRNRIMLAPMCQYSAVDGLANDWHMVHLGKFATGGFGGVMTEASAIVPEGRITHGDLGLWSDRHAEALRPVIAFVRAQGVVAGIQLAHAGRKGAMQRPWHGNGPLDATDASRGDTPWSIVAPSAEPVDDGWLVPEAMTLDGIDALIGAFCHAAVRADRIGCDFVEVHAAHGYLLHTFLSPASNRRDDLYGSDLAGRIRLPLTIAEAVRRVWPETKPLFFRISAVDGFENGWSIEDSVVLAGELKRRGVDVIDCSSGGNRGGTAASSGATIPRGFQAGYAARIRREAGIATQAVGMFLDGPQAEAALRDGQADLIAIGREALFDPSWPFHQAYAMGVDDGFRDWPKQAGWWLARREPSIQAIRTEESP